MRKIVIPLVVITVVAALSCFAIIWLNCIDPKRITVYLPHAYEYVYSDNTAYKGATADTAINAIRDVDPLTPIPLNLKKAETKITLGIKNRNRKAIDEVIMFLEMPRVFTVTRYSPWVQLRANTYYCSFGNINKGIRYSTEESVYFKPEAAGKAAIKYTITGRNFKRTSGVIVFEAY